MKCPHRKVDIAFKAQTEALISELYGAEKAGRFRFDEFKETLNIILSLQEMPESRMSIKTESLLSVYHREKGRFDKIEDLEREANKPVN